jgi:hypothetical protein
MNKRAQVTIFVIAAIVIIALVALIFLLRIEKIPFIPGKTETNPRAFMDNCIEEQMRENINKVLSQGGFIEPQNYKMFSDTKVAYLCYHRGSFEPCINQHPMFLTEISSELKNSISLVIEECFDEFKSSLEKQGYEVGLGESIESEVSLSTGSVYLDIIRDITVTKSGESVNYKDMRLTYLSSLYELAGIANQIANGEAKYCHFEFIGYTNLYPEYLILVKTMSDSTKIYSIISKKTEEQMNIAIRGCAPL